MTRKISQMTPESAARQRETAKWYSRSWRSENPEKSRQACRDSYAANAEARREYAKGRRAVDPETSRAKNREAGAKHRRENPEKAYARYLKKKHGIDVKEYMLLSERQGGLCAICETSPDHKLRVDHCHATGEIRALLCNSCNLGLGLFFDSSEKLRRAAAYLDFYK